VLLNEAPTGQVSEYDRKHLAVYAELLDADATGVGWAEGARTLLCMDKDTPSAIARRCWESHLHRARWILGEGFADAIVAFNRR